MHAAVKNNFREATLKIIETEGPEVVNRVDEYDLTPLHVAAYEGYFDLTCLLLEHGADVNLRDRNGWTPFHCAANGGFLDICEIMIEQGAADVRALTDHNTSALHYLARLAKPADEGLMNRVLELVKAKNGDLNCQNSAGETPLHQACFYGRESAARWLIQHGGDVNAKNQSGETPLHFAARTGNRSAVELLLSAGSDPCIEGNYGTPFCVAQSFHQAHVLDILREAKENTEKDREKQGPRTHSNISNPLNRGGPVNLSFHDVLRYYGSMLLTNGPKRLSPIHRRLRHLRSILVRNLDSPPTFDHDTSNTYVTIYLGASEDVPSSPPIFQSETVNNRMNATWGPLDLLQLSASIPSATEFTFVVWRRTANSEKKDEAVLHLAITLKRLGYIGDSSVLQRCNFPHNSLIFELLDGYYAREDTIIQLKESKSLKSPGISEKEEKRTVVTGSIQNYISLFLLKKELNEAEGTTRNLQQRVQDQIGFVKARTQKKWTRDVHLRRIAALRTGFAKLKQEIDKDTEASEKTRNAILVRGTDLTEAQTALLANKTRVASEMELLRKERHRLDVTKVSLEAIQQNLTSNLRSIFPIQLAPDDNRCLTIIGYRLPNSDFNGCDEEQIATALGYVSQILFMISKWLDTPLRYPITPIGSRSIIADEIAHQISPKFPLYSRGVDRNRFEYAVFLLNRNLEQLLNSLRLEIVTLRHTLPNLLTLLNSKAASSSSSSSSSSPSSPYSSSPSAHTPHSSFHSSFHSSSQSFHYATAPPLGSTPSSFNSSAPSLYSSSSFHPTSTSPTSPTSPSTSYTGEGSGAILASSLQPSPSLRTLRASHYDLVTSPK